MGMKNDLSAAYGGTKKRTNPWIRPLLNFALERS